MNWRAVIVAACLLGAVVGVSAVRGGEPATPDSVEEMVKDLGADKWDTREAAEEKLVAMGPAMYRQLEGLVRSVDEETRARLEEVLRRINRADVEHATPITLHVKDAMAAEVLKEIARQADTTIGPAELVAGIKERVTLDADREPFWEVMVDLCRRWHVSPAERMGIGVRSVTLEKGDMPVGRAEARMEGPFWVMPISAVSGGAVANRTIVTFKLLIDPKFTVQRAATFIKVDKVTDKQGKSLAYNAPFSSDTFSASNNLVWTLVSHITSPADWRVGEFKGTVRIQVSEKAVRWTIENPLTAGKVTKKTALGTCMLTGIEKMDPRKMREFLPYDIYRVSVGMDLTEEAVKQLGGTMARGEELTGLAGLLGGGGGGTIMGGSVRVWDEAGKVSAPVQLGQGMAREGHVDFSTTVGARDGAGQRMGEIVRLEWEMPARVRELTVPVEFRDFSVK